MAGVLPPSGSPPASARGRSAGAPPLSIRRPGPGLPHLAAGPKESFSTQCVVPENRSSLDWPVLERQHTPQTTPHASPGNRRVRSKSLVLMRRIDLMLSRSPISFLVLLAFLLEWSGCLPHLLDHSTAVR